MPGKPTSRAKHVFGCRLRKDFQPAAGSRLTLSRDRWCCWTGLLVSINVSGRDYATSTWECQAKIKSVTSASNDLTSLASHEKRVAVHTDWLHHGHLRRVRAKVDRDRVRADVLPTANFLVIALSLAQSVTAYLANQHIFHVLLHV